MARKPIPIDPNEDGIALLQSKFRKPKSKGVPPPQTLNERLAAKVTLLTDRLYERRKALLENTSESFQSTEVSLEERQEHYHTLKSSPVLMLKTLAASSIIGSDGRLRISNKMLDALVEMSGHG